MQDIHHKSDEEKAKVEILLVEDNEGDVFLIKEVFGKAKILNNIKVAHDGETALSLLITENYVPDLILLDLNLPKIGGMELLRTLKKDEKTRKIPIIILTTSNADRDVKEAYANYVNSYIVKPIDIRKMIEIIQSIENFWVSIVRLPSETLP